LVVAAGVENELAQQFAGGGVDDPDLEVLDEQDDAGSGVGSSEANVVQLLCRSGTEPALSTRSCRTRSWVAGSMAGPGSALGIES
jgi:hypothetical protein